MSLLTPLFLLGGLAIAGPILFHLIRRNTRERFTFSSLMFLKPEPPRLSRKSRLEDILLLLARCAVLALLALAFTRPFVRQSIVTDLDTEMGKHTVLLLDVSASMKREGLWEKTTAKALAFLAQTKPSDGLAILAFGENTRTVVPFEQWSATPEEKRADFSGQALAALEPGWGSTHLGNALITASELLDELDSDQPKQIIALTDRQEGSLLEGLQGHPWPDGIQIKIESVSPDSTGNAGLHLAPRRESDLNASGRLRVRVINSTDATQEQFQLAWVLPGDTNATGLTHIYLPVGQSRSLDAPLRPIGPDWRLALLGDRESFDNELFIVPETPEPIRIHYVGKEKGEDAESMRFYLERAVSRTRVQNIEILAHDPSALAGKLIHPADRLLILTEPLPDEALPEIRRFCESGRPVLMVLKNEGLGPTLSALAQSGPIPLKEEKPKDFSLLTQLDFEHPLLAPFGDPRFSDFTKIHFWKHRRLDEGRLPGSRVLCRFDDGSPALLELPTGKGRLLVLSSGWHPADSQLSLSSKFVPLLYSMIELGREKEAVRADNSIGHPIPLPGSAGAGTRLKGPKGDLQLPAEGGTFRAKDPGIYVLSGPRQATFAVNVAPMESKTAPLQDELLAGLKLPLAPENPEQADLAMAREQAVMDKELENKQKGWRWLILGAIVFALLETWLGGRAWRNPAVTLETVESA